MALVVDLFALYNVVTDWAALASAVDGAYIKYSDGTGPASTPADDYAAHCRDHHITYGGYHFAEPGDPIAQAEAFVAQYQRLGGQLAPALDLESGGIPIGHRVAFAQAFLEHVHRYYPVCVLYASTSWLAQLQPDTWPIPWDRTWAANYGVNNGLRNTITGYDGRIDLHQYTSVGRIAGVADNVDLSYTDDLSVLRIGSNTGEDDSMLVPAGDNEHASVCLKGKSEWYLMTAFGHKVVVHQTVYNGPTPQGTDPAYLPGGTNSDWTFDPNRPGPVPVPGGAVQLTIRYTATHPFTVAAA